jgi:bifunctional non-homologous end joining protein LigD
MSLKEYSRKRNFSKTPEPSGADPVAPGARFVVQLHHASRVHYDLRLEIGGAFKSWAVPKGPSLNPNDTRLAVEVEDHPLDYGRFEGVIPRGNYGAGTVMIWDYGGLIERSAKDETDSARRLVEAWDKGHVTFILSGHKLAGEFALIKSKKAGAERQWLLVKKRDAYAAYEDVTAQDKSAATGRSMDEIAAQADAKGEVWLPGKGPVDPATLKEWLTPTAPPRRARKQPAEPPKEQHAATAKTLKSASPERLPRRLKPLMPHVATEPFSDDEWAYAPDWQGLRAIAEVEPRRASLHSRQLLPFDKRFPDVVRALKALGRTAVLDGELVHWSTDGQAKRPRAGESATYVVYDLLHLDGKNTRELPQRVRRQLLEELLTEARDDVRLGDQWYGDEAYQKALDAGMKHGLNGVVAKRRSAAYGTGTTADWVRLTAKDDGDAAREPHVTHLDKVWWPDEGYTKGDVIAYYRDVAPVILPHLVDRPQSMHRHTDGITKAGFFQKDWTGFLPSPVDSVRIASESSQKTILYLLCQNPYSLLFLANLGCIEFNPWLSRRDSLDLPDYSVIDLDPDKTRKTDYADVVRVALSVRRILEELQLQSFVKTSGSTGMHILVPLDGRSDYDTSRELAKLVCARVEAEFPQLTTTERSPAKRKGRLYLDAFQNGRGQTIAAPYCIRPRPGAPVATPLLWSEVTAELSPAQFTMKNLRARLDRLGADPWAGLPMAHNDSALLAAALTSGND